MDVRLLKAFLAVAEERHFARAADRIGIVQSALSTQVKRLEDILGGPLFVRGRRSQIQLTFAGETLLHEARATVARIERTIHLGRLATRGAAGTIALGYIFSAAPSGVLSRLLAHMRDRYPGLTINASPMETPDQIAALDHATLDLALIRPRREYPDTIRTRVIHREGLVLALPEAHALAKAPLVRATQLADEIFLIPQSGERPGVFETVAHLAKIGGFPYRTRETPDYVTAASIAASGGGVVLAPASLSRLNLPALTYRPLADYQGTIDMALAWRAVAPAFIDDLVDMLTSERRLPADKA